jgi:hypothetical protein
MFRLMTVKKEAMLSALRGHESCLASMAVVTGSDGDGVRRDADDDVVGADVECARDEDDELGSVGVGVACVRDADDDVGGSDVDCVRDKNHDVGGVDADSTCDESNNVDGADVDCARDGNIDVIADVDCIGIHEAVLGD